MCPYVGIIIGDVGYFYVELTYREHQFIEMMFNGEFLLKEPNKPINYLNKLIEKTHSCTGPSTTDRNSIKAHWNLSSMRGRQPQNRVRNFD